VICSGMGHTGGRAAHRYDVQLPENGR
jgi:hypothetical protein